MNSTTVFRLALGAICFTLTPALPAQTWEILHAFTLGTDLVNPGTTMVEVSPGIYLGSYLGGLFEITPTGTFSVLDDFSSSTYSVAGYGAVAPASNGYFYGIANSPENASAVYRLAPSGKKTIINDALTLSSPLVQGNDGDLWGAQGSDTAGYSVFKMSTGGALTTVASGLNGPTTGPLLQASDGNFYGATYLFSDSPNPGQIYRISPSGNLTILYTFPQGNGSYGGLMQASNGLIYGTWVDRAAQCPNPGGGVFSLSLAGSYKSVLQFAGCYPQGTAIGPLAGLLQASDGRLYGSLSGLGTYNDGSIFSISLNGTSFDKVAEFDYADGASP